MAKFCRYCGKQLNDDAVFCRYCGRDLSGSGERESGYQEPMYQEPVYQEPMYRDPVYPDAPYQGSAYPEGPRKRKGAGAFLAAAAAILAVCLIALFVYPGFLKRVKDGADGKETAVQADGDNTPGGSGTANTGGKESAEGFSADSLITAELTDGQKAQYADIAAAVAAGTLEPVETDLDLQAEHYFSNLSADESSRPEVPEGEEEPPQPEMTELMLSEGNSSAFSKEVLPGITVSAPENALDKDREITMEAFSYEELDDLQERLAVESGFPGLVLNAWELDAGLEDDELLPGKFTVGIDLDEYGIDPELQEYVRVFRIDDSGKCYQYASGMDGSTVFFESQKNSVIITTIAALVVSGVVGNEWVIPWANGAHGSETVMNREVYVDGKLVYNIIPNYDEQIIFIGEQMKTIAKNAATNKMHKKARDEYRKRYGNEQTDQKKYNQVLTDVLAKELENDPDILRLQAEIDKFRSSASGKETMDIVDRTEKYCRETYRYYKALGILLPDFVMNVYLSTKLDDATDGVTPNVFYGNWYVVLNVKTVGSRTERNYENLLLTIVHEFFHASQRCYVDMSRANKKFEEATAQLVEVEAYDYFRAMGMIQSDQSKFHEGRKHLYYYGLPLDQYKATYFEGVYDLNALDSRRSDSGYPLAWFIAYLKDNCVREPTWHYILQAYKTSAWFPSVTGTLKKSFGLDDKTLTKYYLEFAKSKQADFYKMALQYVDAKPVISWSERLLAVEAVDSRDPRIMFAPTNDAGVYSLTDSVVNAYKEGTGGAGNSKVALFQQNYSIRVRRIRSEVRNNDMDMKAAQLIVISDLDESPLGITFHDMDLLLLPVGREDWKKCRFGLFYEPRKLSDDGLYSYLLEADGGTASTLLSWTYNIYTLLPPETPECSIEDNALYVSLPEELSRQADDGYVDSYELKIYEKLPEVVEPILVHTQVIPKDQWETLKKDRWKMELPDMELYDRDDTVLQVTIAERIEAKGDAPVCVGPESEPWTNEGDIYGTWELHSAGQGYSSEMLDSMVGMMGQSLGSAGGAGMEAFGDAYKQYLDAYNSANQQAGAAQADGKMYVMRSEEVVPGKNRKDDPAEKVHVVMEFGGDSAPWDLSGTYDRNSMKMVLKPNSGKSMYTGSDGKKYDLAQYGLLPKSIELEFKKEGEELTFSGEAGLESSTATYSTLLSGRKTSPVVKREGAK